MENIQARRFDFGFLPCLTKLRVLEVTGSRTPLDCGLLQSLPLEELVLEHCATLENPQALLQLPRVRRVSLTGSPVDDATVARLEQAVAEHERQARGRGQSAECRGVDGQG